MLLNRNPSGVIQRFLFRQTLNTSDSIFTSGTKDRGRPRKRLMKKGWKGLSNGSLIMEIELKGNR